MAGGGDGSAAAMLGEVNTINEKIEELYELIAAEDYTAEELDSGDFTYEDDLAYLESEKETLLNEAVKLYVQEGKTDSAIAALSSLDASWAKERMVELFVINADYDAALNALSEVNTDDVAGADFVSLHEIVISVAQDGRNLLQLNKEEQSALESFAGKQSPSGVAAENILEFAAGANYPEVFDAELEDEELRFSAPPSGEITIYPNPANNELFIQVNSENIFEAYSFEMYSLTGTLILSGNLQQQELHALNLNSIPSGIYLIRIHTNGVTKQIEKIVKE
ncbi:MAG: T9SS type A sorting domain-containing protein [Chitinophagales bacterium]|nr:T9SS type A sorting domain-containing protein [Chitinophagales bacterium]